MPKLDPTYLRYIYDNLIKGSIHPENSSELPEGLIGLYEEAFDEHQPAQYRQQVLNRFALFSLLKKEVSIQFIADILGEKEDVIFEFITSNASWFNSPESGKFQLYHERLKIYILQKLSINAIRDLNKRLISVLENELEAKKESEFEKYALTFLCSHLQVEAFAMDNQLYVDKLYNTPQIQTRNGIKLS